MKFELTIEEQRAAEEFKKTIEDIYGSIVNLEYIFSYGGGIGRTLKVRCNESGFLEKDITDYDSW